MTKIKNGSIGISPNYVKDWTIEEAIREIVQNMLDARDEFGCDGHINFKDGEAIVKDNGEGIEMRHLVMGISEKKEGSIGQFGEGLKLGLLVFAREGRQIEIWSKGKRITPEIEYNETYETEMISLNIEELPAHWAANHNGTSIKFECTREELNEGKNYFLEYAKRNIEDFNWVVKDMISEPGGKIWINNSMVGEIEKAKFSYHFDGKRAREAINRDRGSIDTEELGAILKQELGKTRSIKWMKEMLEIISTENDYWEKNISFYSHWVDRNNHKLWKRAITEVFGDKVLSSGDAWDGRAQRNGHRLVKINSYSWKETLQELGMKTAKDVIKDAEINEKAISLSDLTVLERSNLNEAKEIIEKKYNECSEISILEHLGSDFPDNAMGAYDPKKDMTYLKRSILEDFKKTTFTLLHETVHKHSRASDLTEQFEDALCSLATDLMIGGETN